MERKNWSFNSLSDRIKTTAGATVGLGILGVGLAYLFTPAALAVAFGYGVYSFGTGIALAIPKFKEYVVNNEIKKGRWEPVAADAPAAKMAAEISAQLGRKEAPKMYTIDDKTVSKMALPFGLRWMLKIPDIRNKAMEGVFAALPGTNIILSTKEALGRELDPKALKFIVAHEMSHLQAKDNLSPSLLVRSLTKKATTLLFWGTLAAAGASLVGLSIPILAGTSTLWALGGLTAVWAGAKAANSIGLRAVEERADRNALYITRDFEAGRDALATIDPSSKEPGPGPAYKEALLDHPSFWRRIETMKEAFAQVSQYPVLAPAATAPAPALKAPASAPR